MLSRLRPIGNPRAQPLYFRLEDSNIQNAYLHNPQALTAAAKQAAITAAVKILNLGSVEVSETPVDSRPLFYYVAWAVQRPEVDGHILLIMFVTLNATSMTRTVTARGHHGK